jgi:hypothetical protein
VLNNIIEEYKQKILTKENTELRNFFLMKIDEIAGQNYVWYFIYGSNLSQTQLENRLRDLEDKILQEKPGLLKNFRFAYNKNSKDGTAKANIVEDEGQTVEGLAVLLKKETLDKFHKKFEKGYDLIAITITVKDDNIQNNNEREIEGWTYISKSITNEKPDINYVKTILTGAVQKGLSTEYIDRFLKM